MKRGGSEWKVWSITMESHIWYEIYNMTTRPPFISQLLLCSSTFTSHTVTYVLWLSQLLSYILSTEEGLLFKACCGIEKKAFLWNMVSDRPGARQLQNTLMVPIQIWDFCQEIIFRYLFETKRDRLDSMSPGGGICRDKKWIQLPTEWWCRRDVSLYIYYLHVPLTLYERSMADAKCVLFSSKRRRKFLFRGCCGRTAGEDPDILHICSQSQPELFHLFTSLEVGFTTTTHQTSIDVRWSESISD